MLSNHLILCYLLLLLPSICLSTILFQWIGSLAQVAKVLKFQLPHQSFQYLGLISFRIGWFDLLAIQGTLQSLQHHSSKASILQWAAFFMVQLSHPYMTTGKKQSFDQTDLCRQSQSLSLLIISNPSAPLTVRQWFQLEVILPLRGQLTMFGDTFSCHNWRRLLLASSKQMSGMLTIPQCTRQPLQQKIMFLKLRISALWSSLDNWPIPQSL